MTHSFANDMPPVDAHGVAAGGDGEGMMRKLLLPAAALVLAGGQAVLAHHSFTAFDHDRTVDVTGTVKSFQYTNPHSWIDLVVKTPDGKVQEWLFEGQPPSQLRTRGWTSTSLKPGDVVTVTFNPRRDGTPAGSFKMVKRADGQMVGKAGPPPRGKGKGDRDSQGHPNHVHPLLASFVPQLKFFDPLHKGPGSRLTGKVTAPTRGPRELDGRYWPEGGLLMPGGMTRMMPYNDAGATMMKGRLEQYFAGKPRRDPPTFCVPSGPVRPMQQGFPLQITVTPSVVTMTFMEDHITRVIHMDRGHPAQLKPTVMGDAVGHWEGNALVVDTIGVRDGGWLDEYGSPASGKLHLVERYTKLPGGNLKLDAVLTDPTYYSQPVPYQRMLFWNPIAQWDEIICEENNRDAAGAAK